MARATFTGAMERVAVDSMAKASPMAAMEDKSSSELFKSTSLSTNSTGGNGEFCYNASDCIYPQRCIVESRERRYCADSALDRVWGRTLFDTSADREPGLFECDRCHSPLLLVDFGAPSDVGANRCISECELPVGSTNETHIGESFMTSNCRTRCEYAPIELHGDAKLGSSPYHTGFEPSDELWAARAAVAAAQDAATEAAAAAAAAGAIALSLAAVSSAEASELGALYAEADRRADVVAALRAKVQRAQATLDDAHIRERRASAGALEAAEKELRIAEANAAEATANASAVAARRESFVPVLESEAPNEEAMVAAQLAEAARVNVTRLQALEVVAALRLLPLGEGTAAQWGHGVWGGAADVSAAGGLLQLTDATRSATGWAVLRPGRPMASFTIEADVWIGGGSGGDGLSVSFAPEAPEALSGGDGTLEHTHPPADASYGLGATVERDGVRASYYGKGLSLALRTRPAHAAQVWLDGELVAERTYEGCPAPDGSFGGACAPCADCPNCPACSLCVPSHACPLRSPRRFVRLALSLAAATSNAAHPTLTVRHDGLLLFPSPVPLPTYACGKPDLKVACALVLGARSGDDADDHHWLDNVRMSGPPGRPAPPALVNATARALLLAWYPPHHGGEEVLLYRLRMWRGTRWNNVYVGSATNHTVHYLEHGTAYLFRLQAYNANGWGPSSPSASFATVTWPLASHPAPPRVPRVNGATCLCGGKTYIAGGQPVGGGGGAGGAVLGVLEEYDLASRSWVRRADMATPRSHLALACVRNATLVAVGGYGTTGTPPYTYERYLTAVEQYDPAADAWTTRPDAHAARYYLTAVGTPDGVVFALGGYGSKYGHSAAAVFNESILGALEKFDPATGVWSRKPDLPQPAYGVGLGVFGCADRCRLLAAGGYAAGGFTDAAFVYDTRAETWTYAAPLPAPRFVPSVLAHTHAEVAHVMGGYELSLPSAAARQLHRQASLASVFEYDAASDSFWPIPTESSWRSILAFDWRPPVGLAGGMSQIAREAYEYAMTEQLPPERHGPMWRAPSSPMQTRRIFVRATEHDLPEPYRCRHGRNHMGCLAGYGVQRDEQGRELGPEERVEPTEVLYPPAWQPPLDFDKGVATGIA